MTRELSGRELLAALAFLVASFCFCLLPLAPRNEIPARPLATAFALTLAVVAFLAVIVVLVRRAPGDRALAAAAVVAAVLAVLLRAGAPGTTRDLAFDLALIVFASATGRLFANQVQEAWWLMPLGLTAAVADLVSVFAPQAPTRKMLETNSPILDYLLLVWPNLSGKPARGFLGVSDLVIAAVLAGVTVRFGFSFARTLVTLAVALGGCLALAGGLGLGLPAIPFMAVAYVFAHRADLMASYRNRKTSLT